MSITRNQPTAKPTRKWTFSAVAGSVASIIAYTAVTLLNINPKYDQIIFTLVGILLPFVTAQIAGYAAKERDE